MSGLYADPADFTSRTALTATPVTFDATIGVEPATVETRTWWVDRMGYPLHQPHAIVKRRDGKVHMVFWARPTDTVAELDARAARMAPAWHARHVAPVGVA